MDLEPARAEVSSHQLEVPNMGRLRGELVTSSIDLHFARRKSVLQGENFTLCLHLRVGPPLANSLTP